LSYGVNALSDALSRWLAVLLRETKYKWGNPGRSILEPINFYRLKKIVKDVFIEMSFV
jgi:hypothetical protein